MTTMNDMFLFWFFACFLFFEFLNSVVWYRECADEVRLLVPYPQQRGGAGGCGRISSTVPPLAFLPATYGFVLLLHFHFDLLGLRRSWNTRLSMDLFHRRLDQTWSNAPPPLHHFSSFGSPAGLSMGSSLSP